MKVYVASSWRNEHQQDVVAALRGDGHDVYDFKNPEPGDHGFAWSEVDPDWKKWTTDRFSKALDHPIAAAGFGKDMRALEACGACVLVLPCGRSAHLELGWAAGQGRLTIVYSPKLEEPELMVRMCDYFVGSLLDVRVALSVDAPPPRWQRDMDLRRFGPSHRSAAGEALCSDYRHRECRTCGGCWRHKACTCLAKSVQ